MKNMIEELILQNSLFMERINYGEKYDEIFHENNKNQEKFLKTLNEEQAKMFNEIINGQIRLEAEATTAILLQALKQP